MTTPEGYEPDTYYASTDTALAWEDPGTKVLLSHTGTLDTTGHNGANSRVITRGTGADAYDVEIGSDNSEAAINQYLDPDLDATNLPDGHVAAPVYDGPIF